ncbi:MAG: LamG domain-containing protein, partial [Acidimicrobiia bacterium]|nr:LamG domain-containing protein [Acidimicrobiia bacterium]
TYRPGTSPVRDDSLPILAMGGTLRARIEVAGAPASGIICALGDRNGGYALYCLDGRLTFALAVGSEPVAARANAELAPGEHEVAATLAPTDDGGATITVTVDDHPVASTAAPLGIPFAFQHGGTALRLGSDTGFPVHDDYRCPFPWNGTIADVTISSAMGFDTGRGPSVDDSLHAD